MSELTTDDEVQQLVNIHCKYLVDQGYDFSPLIEATNALIAKREKQLKLTIAAERAKVAQLQTLNQPNKKGEQSE